MADDFTPEKTGSLMSKIPIYSTVLAFIVLVISSLGIAAAKTVRLNDLLVEKDIEYGKAGEFSLKLDLYHLETPPQKPLPVIVWIHGGGWEKGDKGSGRDRLTPLVSTHNFIGVSIDYRLTSIAPWPAQIHDSKAAIRWIRANAKRYGIDTERICVWGSSAGGHLASLLGTSSDHAELEGTNGSPSESSKVRCVADLSGPSDFEALSKSNPELFKQNKPVFKLLGGSLETKLSEARAASPIGYVTKGDSPFLIIHGTNDATVAIEQSETFKESLVKSGVDATLIKIEGGGHKLEGADIDKLVKTFFEKHLLSGS